jgi:hypothetical protein
LGEKFGVIDPKPPVPTALSGGGNRRLAVLSADLTAELLEVPAEDLPGEKAGATANDEKNPPRART